MDRKGALKGEKRVREALMSGIFYPDDGAELARIVDGLLGGASPPGTDSTAILSPHASISYSGKLQALAFASARSRNPKTVILLCHRHRPDAEAVFLPESSIFRTPLGDLPVDEDLLESLESSATYYERADLPHWEEHAIEVQLPFVQRLFPNAFILPAIVNFHDIDLALQLAKDLDSSTAEDPESYLLVASCNAGSAPDPAKARRMGEMLTSRVLGNAKGRARPCVEAFLASRPARTAKPALLGRTSSKEAEENAADQPWNAWEGADAVVEYVAVAFYKGGAA